MASCSFTGALCTAVFVAVAMTTVLVRSETNAGVSWKYHAWDQDTLSELVGLNSTATLPHSEQGALEIICETLSTLPRTAHLLAVSASAFHPALNAFCQAFNVTCVFLGANEGERVPDEWLHNAVRFYPAPELRSRSIQDYVTWAVWRHFVVLYSNFHDLEQVQSLIEYPLGPTLFRPMNLDRVRETRQLLRRLRRETEHRFVVHIPEERVPMFFNLAGRERITGMAHSFLLVSEASRIKVTMNDTFFNRYVASRLKHGVNFTSHHFDGVQLRGDSLDRKSYKLPEALEILLNFAYKDWLNGTPPVFVTGYHETEGFPKCKHLLTDRTAEFRALLEKQISERLGVVDFNGRQHYNFSFSVRHMARYRKPSGRFRFENEKFAMWTADKGYQLVGMAPGMQNLHKSRSMKELNLTVTTVIDPPFSILRDFDDYGRPLKGNDRWTGMAIELFKEVARRLNITDYHIDLCPDGKFGSPTESEEKPWSGMIGDLMAGTAEVAVASLVITYDREMVVDFTTPYMSFGLSVIMKKPEQHTDPLQFMLPFSSRVWIYMMLAWLSTSLVMFICARLSPYEWYSHSDCVPLVENQFNPLNSLWFTIGSLMQQGSDLAPRASSTRMVATTWWFFTLLLISSYTANLAAFLTTKRLDAVESIDDLASQSKIKYGCNAGGATNNFFKNSRIPLYKRMFDSMEAWSSANDSYVARTSDGIERVKQGNYAYVLESTFNQYYHERDCDLMQVGGIFNPGSYAFAVPQGNTVLRDQLSEVILQLHKEQFIESLSVSWMKEFNISGPPCSEESADAPKTGTLDVVSFGGVFVSMLVGFALAILVCVIELLWRSFVLSSRSERSLLSLCNEQILLALDFKVTRKSPVPTTSPPCACVAVVAQDPLPMATGVVCVVEDASKALAVETADLFVIGNEPSGSRQDPTLLGVFDPALLLPLATGETTPTTEYGCDSDKDGELPAELPPELPSEAGQPELAMENDKPELGDVSRTSARGEISPTSDNALPLATEDSAADQAIETEGVTTEAVAVESGGAAGSPVEILGSTKASGLRCCVS